MPIREYSCTVCNNVVERLENIHDNGLQHTHCEECKHGFMIRKISAPSIHLDDSFPSAKFKKDKDRR